MECVCTAGMRSKADFVYIHLKKAASDSQNKSVCTPGAQPEAGFVYIHHTKRRQSIKRGQNEIASTKQKAFKDTSELVRTYHTIKFILNKIRIATEKEFTIPGFSNYV